MVQSIFCSGFCRGPILNNVTVFWKLKCHRKLCKEGIELPRPSPCKLGRNGLELTITKSITPTYEEEYGSLPFCEKLRLKVKQEHNFK